LELFQSYYGGSFHGFLEAVLEDASKPPLEKRHVARDAIAGFAEWLSRRGCQPKTIRAYVAAVQACANYYDIPISVRYARLPKAVPQSKKYPWTVEDVEKFVQLIDDPLYQSIAVSLFQSGLSISDLLKLRYDDIRIEYEKSITPLCLDMYRMKTDVPFMTFIGAWGVNMLSKYLEEYDRASIRPDEPLYPVTARAVEKVFQRITYKTIGGYKGKNPLRPHSLRAAFRTLLADAKMPSQEIEFFMGHKLPDQQRVYMSRSREGWRQLYRKYEHALTPPSLRHLLS